MSFGGRLIHTLTHVRTPRDMGDVDDYNQPEDGTPVETSVRGLVQPRAASEMLDYRSAGSEVADHVIFLAPMDLDPADSFLYAGERYQISGIRSFLFGRTPHLEVDARRVVPAAVIEAAS